MDDFSFTTTLPILVFTRPKANPPVDWQEVEHGPGYIQLPADLEIGIRTRLLDDVGLKTLINEVKHLATLTYLNLSENRRISNEGLEALAALRGLTILNLSSVDLTNAGLPLLLALPRLENLDLSYCNRITDTGLKQLAGLRNLSHLNLQGCVKISNGGMARLRRNGLTIRK